MQQLPSLGGQQTAAGREPSWSDLHSSQSIRGASCDRTLALSSQHALITAAATAVLCCAVCNLLLTGNDPATPKSMEKPPLARSSTSPSWRADLEKETCYQRQVRRLQRTACRKRFLGNHADKNQQKWAQRRKKKRSYQIHMQQRSTVYMLSRHHSWSNSKDQEKKEHKSGT